MAELTLRRVAVSAAATAVAAASVAVVAAAAAAAVAAAAAAAATVRRAPPVCAPCVLQEGEDTVGAPEQLGRELGRVSVENEQEEFDIDPTLLQAKVRQ